MPPTHMAIDQYGHTEHNLGPNPRQELLRRYDRTSAQKVYVDKTDGSARHIGWIVAGHWFTVYRVTPMENEA